MVDDLFEKYKGLVSKYCTEDYFVDGLLCLQGCAKHFDATKGQFSSYLRVCLKRMMKKLRDKERKVDEEYQPYMTPVAEERIDIDLSCLDILQKHVINEVYWKDTPLREIALQLQLPIKDVVSIKIEAEQLLRSRG